MNPSLQKKNALHLTALHVNAFFIAQNLFSPFLISFTFVCSWGKKHLEWKYSRTSPSTHFLSCFQLLFVLTQARRCHFGQAFSRQDQHDDLNKFNVIEVVVVNKKVTKLKGLGVLFSQLNKGTHRKSLNTSIINHCVTVSIFLMLHYTCMIRMTACLCDK